MALLNTGTLQDLQGLAALYATVQVAKDRPELLLASAMPTSAPAPIPTAPVVDPEPAAIRSTSSYSVELPDSILWIGGGLLLAWILWGR